MPSMISILWSAWWSSKANVPFAENAPLYWWRKGLLSGKLGRDRESRRAWK